MNVISCELVLLGAALSTLGCGQVTVTPQLQALGKSGESVQFLSAEGVSLPGVVRLVDSYDGAANVRREPGGELVTVLTNGDLVDIQRIEGSWVSLVASLSQSVYASYEGSAWVHNTVVFCEASPNYCVVKSADGEANIRQDYSGGRVVDVRHNGDVLKIDREEGSWLRVSGYAQPSDWTRYEEAVWVHTSLLREVKPREIPYFCQLKNSYQPNSTCGNTSLAMGLSAVLGRTITPDYLYSYNMNRFGYNLANSRFRFAEVARALGASSSRAAVLSESEMKAELDQGRLLVMQGYFTNSYGHIVLIVGYNSSGFVVNDPYGRWAGGRVGSGYSLCTGSSGPGKGVIYSYADMRSQSLLNPNFSVGVIAR